MRNKLIFILIIISSITMLWAQKPVLSNKSLEKSDLSQITSTFKSFDREIASQRSTLLKQTSRSRIDNLSAAKERALQFVRDLPGENSEKEAENSNESFEILHRAESPAGYHIRLRQTIDGIPVYNSDLTVSISKRSGKISSMAGQKTSLEKLKSKVISLDAEQAIFSARKYLSAEGESILEQSKLEIFPSESRGLRIAYHVSIVSDHPSGDWQVFVDAESGDILHVENIMMFGTTQSADGKGYVWDPDPLTTAEVIYGGAYVDNSDKDTLALNNEGLEVVLRDLTLTDSGYILSGPYAELKDISSPADTFPVFSDPDSFHFTRSQQGFEDVMVYYHIDKSYRRILELGFDVPGLLQFKADPHGRLDDNSDYLPTANQCRFGIGGVDDAEDADVIWHEYAHAFQQNITGGMSSTDVQEGSSDYWTTSYSRSVSEYRWGDVFTWDGHNEFWPGRVADLTDQNGHYPDDYNEFGSPHEKGQVWSSALMEIWEKIGRDVTDALFIQTHFLWGNSPSMPDAAEAFIQADRDLFSGAHLADIYDVFGRRGLVDISTLGPVITHTPYENTDDFVGPYRIFATITSGVFPLDTTASYVVFGYGSLTNPDTIWMEPEGTPDLYYADIPSAQLPVFEVDYYIFASDSIGNITVSPDGAPGSYYFFLVAPDTNSLEIIHNYQFLLPLDRWPLKIRALISDSAGIDSAYIRYAVETGINNRSGTVNMRFLGNDIYEAILDFDSTGIREGDLFIYSIHARNMAAVPNWGHAPLFMEYYRSGFVDSYILLVDDEILTVGKNKTTDNLVRTSRLEPPSIITSGDLIQNRLTEADYQLNRVPMDSALNLNFDLHSLLIHTAGRNDLALANENYRNKLTQWAKAGSLNKIIVEGGEVAHNTFSDSEFMQNVLHVLSWLADSAGNYTADTEFLDHPVMNGIHQIPDTFLINYQDIRDQDIVAVDTDIFSPLKAISLPLDESSGLVIHNPFPDSSRGQTAYFPFNGAAADTSVFQDLMENTVAFLLDQYLDNSGIDEEDHVIPAEFVLGQNYPNPFNPSTTILFETPRAELLYLNIYNVLGQKVKTLLEKSLSAGIHRIEWDGKDESGIPAASGVYFYQLRAGNYHSTKKMILVR